MADEKTTFLKIAVKSDVKREIDILAASEQRATYEVVDDMLNIYKAVVMGKKPHPLSKEVSVSDVVASHLEQIKTRTVMPKIKQVAKS
jgi:hypothetical protein